MKKISFPKLNIILIIVCLLLALVSFLIKEDWSLGVWQLLTAGWIWIAGVYRKVCGIQEELLRETYKKAFWS